MLDPEVSRFLRDQWREIAEQFWPETVEEQLGAEIDRLAGELALDQARLLRGRQKIEKVRNRLELLSRPLPNSDSDADASNTSETQGPRIDRLRGRLQALERAYTRLLARFESRKRQRAALREGLLSPGPSERDEVGSDPDHLF
jgi:hypothetical protein